MYSDAATAGRNRCPGGVRAGLAPGISLVVSITNAQVTASDCVIPGNAGKPDNVLQWGCWNTYGVAQSADSMGHARLLPGDRSATTTIGAAALTSVSAYQFLATALIPRLRTGINRGAAIVAAMREISMSSPACTGVVIATALLGDPAMNLR